MHSHRQGAGGAGMSKCSCYECNPYGEPEPDQVDMMNADELRSEFRKLLQQHDELLAAAVDFLNVADYWPHTAANKLKAAIAKAQGVV